MTKRQLVTMLAPLDDDAEILTDDMEFGSILPIDGVEQTIVHAFPLAPWFDFCYPTAGKCTHDVPAKTGIILRVRR